MLPSFAPAEHALLWAPPAVYSLVYVPLLRRAVRSPAACARLLSLREAHNALLALGSLFVAARFIALRMQSPGPWSAHAYLCAPAPASPALEALWYMSKLYEWVVCAETLNPTPGRSTRAAPNTRFTPDAGYGHATRRGQAHRARRGCAEKFQIQYPLSTAIAPLAQSSLHYNHHMTTATVVASHLVGRDRRTSIFDFATVVNAIVHTLMYAYYWSPSRLRVLKRLLTRLQITQHAAVLASILYTSAVLAYGDECDVAPFANALSLAMYFMYLVQFVAFYVRTYDSEKRKSDDAKAKRA